MPELRESPEFLAYLQEAKATVKDKAKEIRELRVKLEGLKAQCAEIGPQLARAEADKDEPRVKSLTDVLLENFKIKQRATARLAALGERV